MEIIIVDGNSADDTCKVYSDFSAKYPGTFRIINEKESKGKPAALNLALPYATGEIVGVFDADSVPEKDARRKVASYLGDKQLMAVQGRTTSLNEKKKHFDKGCCKRKRKFAAVCSFKRKLPIHKA